MKICFATNNKNKIKEVWQVLPPDFSLLSLLDIGCTEELEESRDTMEGNALQKAQYVFDKYKVPCFADDSGLEVDALDGAPGVYSARYAGSQRNDDDNINLLLSELSKHKNRQAQFRTVIALMGFGSEPIYFHGVVRGRIIESRRGDRGFGYDPVFVPSGSDRTFAEMALNEKNQISHRAKAVQQLVTFLGMYRGT
jgi:XTP/dITP diphosphohydrolase